MFRIIRRIASQVTVRDRDEPRKRRGPLVDILECELAHFDNIGRALAGPRRNG